MSLTRTAILGMTPALAALPAWAAEPARPAPIPVAPVGAGGLLEVVLALVLVLALIAGMAWMMRRVSGFGQVGGGMIRVLGGVHVGQRERVVLIQVGDQQLLLGVAPGRVDTLHVLAEPVSLGAAPPGGGEGFAERLAAAIKKGARS